MPPWLPFVLLPLYFAGLVGAVVWLAPRTADEAVSKGEPGTAPRTPHALSGRRERPKHGTA